MKNDCNNTLSSETKTSNKLLLSVIVPVYNVEKYLDRCLDSIVNQTYRNLEIILVDDGSTDKSGEKCEDWKLKDSRIKVIHKGNQGLGYARNTGMEYANGDYIAFVDSDDWIDTDMYASLLSNARKNDADIVYCGHHWEKNPGVWKDIRDVEEEVIIDGDNIFQLIDNYVSCGVSGNYTMSVWHSVYKRNVIKVQFFSEREVVSEDLHFQLSAILNSKKIVYVPQCYYYYALNSVSLSHTFNFNKFYLYQNLVEKIRVLFSLYKIDESKADTFYFATSLWILRLQISASGLSVKERVNNVNKIGTNKFWQSSANNRFKRNNNKYFNLLTLCLMHGNRYTRYISAWFDYWGVVRRFGFRH